MRSDPTTRELVLRWALAIGSALAAPTIARAEQPASPTTDPGPSTSAPPGTPRRGPRAEWELSFPDEISVVEYARRLDYFGIEIAAVSNQGKIEYIAQSSQPKPRKKVGTLADDPRLYIGWRQGELIAADRKLLAKAGINAQGKDLWHFFPPPTQKLMAEVERAHARREPSEIKRTRFEIRPAKKDGQYEFVVVEQELIGGVADPSRASDDSPSEER